MKYKLNEWFRINLLDVNDSIKSTQICIGDTTTKYNQSGNIINTTDFAYFENYIRPAISLNPGIELASDSGNSTKNTPYKVSVN